MKAKVYSIDGEERRDIELNDDVFGCSVSDHAIYYAVNGELQNRRAGTAATKNRKKVKGSNAKPWRQKGTGHARAGDKKSPLWVGGGTIFGPQPRDYRVRLPRSTKRAAMRSILTKKLAAESVTILEDFTVESGKTRELVGIMKNFTDEQRTVFVYHEDDAMLKRAGRNVPWLKMLSYDRLSAHELFYGRRVIMTESAVQLLNELYGKKLERGRT